LNNEKGCHHPSEIKIAVPKTGCVARMKGKKDPKMTHGKRERVEEGTGYSPEGH